MRLKDKTVLITASTRGIGYSCVKACAKEGAVVYMGARNLEKAKEEAEALNEQGLNVKYVYNDANDTQSYSSMMKSVIADEGRIDVLVNNFGTSNTKKDLDFTNTNVTDFLDIVTVNIRSVFMASQEAAKYMAAQGNGSIINISSVGGMVPDISQIAYGTAKASINYLTKLIALQEAKHGIRCNAVLPGMTATDAVKDSLSDEFKELFLRQIPLGRMALPEEIAAAVVFLGSDESAYTTGQILTVSGGFGLGTPLYGELAQKESKR